MKEGVSPSALLARCIEVARLHGRVLDDAEKHEVFVLSATPEGRAKLMKGRLKIPPFVADHLARWHAAANPDATLGARIALMAWHLELSKATVPPEWETAMRIVVSRARVTDRIKAHACIACAVIFDLGDAPIRRVSRDTVPYDAVYAAAAMEIERIRSLQP